MGGKSESERQVGSRAGDAGLAIRRGRRLALLACRDDRTPQPPSSAPSAHSFEATPTCSWRIWPSAISCRSSSDPTRDHAYEIGTECYGSGSRRFCPGSWKRHLLVVRPETVIRWHRRGWRLYWTWRSRARFGRPRLSPEVRALIARMAFENPTWGTQRIRGELLKLGIAVSARSIRRYRTRASNRPPSQTWRTFLSN